MWAPHWPVPLPCLLSPPPHTGNFWDNLKTSLLMLLPRPFPQPGTTWPSKDTGHHCEHKAKLFIIQLSLVNEQKNQTSNKGPGCEPLKTFLGVMDYPQPLKGFSGTGPASEILKFGLVSDTLDFQFLTDSPSVDFGGQFSGPEPPPALICKKRC